VHAVVSSPKSLTTGETNTSRHSQRLQIDPETDLGGTLHRDSNPCSYPIDQTDLMDYLVAPQGSHIYAEFKDTYRH